MKHIAIFCDGTWQSFSQKTPTNVARLAAATLPVFTAEDGAPVAQAIFYDDGVGVGGGIGFADEVTRLAGGVFGAGLDKKIADAYEFICLNYTPGDRLFIFGFSRGAYTARSLAGLLRRCWILKREHVSLVDDALNIYRTFAPDAPQTQAFKDAYCYPPAPLLDVRAADPKAAAAANDTADAGSVQYIGVWDTVGELGVPTKIPFAKDLDRKYQFHDQSLSRFVFSARHAVSIDEMRETFRPSLWDNLPTLNANAQADALPRDQQPYQQQWFPGDHGCVGGGKDDHGVSACPLLWIAEGARRAGLTFDETIIQGYANAANPNADFPPLAQGIAAVVMRAIGESPRPGPDDPEVVSTAARQRLKARPDYDPPTLSKVRDRL